MSTEIDRETPSGLENWQADAFVAAARAWEVWCERTGTESGVHGVGRDAGRRTHLVDGARHDTDPTHVARDIIGAGTELTRWVHTRPPTQAERDAEIIRASRPRPTIRWRNRYGSGTTTGVHDITTRCDKLITRGELAGRRCPRVAGQGTNHLGVGQCVAHGGARGRGRAYGAWLMAHAFGQELNLTPWEALLQAVRIAAGKVAYCEMVLRQANSDLELEGRVTRSGEGESAILVHPDTGEPLGVGQFRDLSFWVKQSELWHDRMAKTAKMAIDAGVAKWQIEKEEADAQAIARTLQDVLDGLEGVIDDVTLSQVRGIMRTSLLRMDRERAQVTAGPGPDAGHVDSRE